MEGVRLGRYKLGRRLATGGMAEVFAATIEGAAGFEKLVAIKRILPHLCEDPEFVEMFQEEARLASRLSHANIAQVFDFAIIDGQHLLAMEWVHGRDLRRVLRASEGLGLPPGPARSAFIAREVARALDHAHSTLGKDGAPLGIVHRDVSPQNVLLSFAGEVKLTDFGIAKAAQRSVATSAGVIKGKTAYMSPEQARGEPLDARSDIFALGVVLWESLTGRRLFSGATDAEILRAVEHLPAPPPSTIRPDVPRSLDDIVTRALHKERDGRHGRASELETDLTDVMLRHARGAKDLDLSTWLAAIFSEDERSVLPKIVEQRSIAPRQRQDTRLASFTPPPPGPLPEAPAAGALPLDTRTADLPPRPRRRGRTARLLALGVTLASVLVAVSYKQARRWGPTSSSGDLDASVEVLAGPAIEPSGMTPSGGVATRPSLSPSLDETLLEATRSQDTRTSEALSTGLLPTARAPHASEPVPVEGRIEGARKVRTKPPESQVAPYPPTRSDVPVATKNVGRTAGEWFPPGGATVLAPAPRAPDSMARSIAPAPLVPAGERLRARLVSGVEASASVAVEASLTRGQVVDGVVVLPRGTRLKGTAHPSGERLLVDIESLTLPSGLSIELKAQVYGDDGLLGLPALDPLTAKDRTSEPRILTAMTGAAFTVLLLSDIIVE